MKKRMISMFLAIVMVIGMLPVIPGQAALSAQKTQELYLKMLEIGLVDEYGTLIEDNSFLLPDGTVLESLTELKEVLYDPNTDPDMEITVMSTGESATVEQIAGAIEIETYMAEYAALFNGLASGAQQLAENTPAASVSGATLEEYTRMKEKHNVFLDYEIYKDKTELSLHFNLVNDKGDPVTLDEDYTFRVGLFDGSLRLMREEDEIIAGEDGTFLDEEDFDYSAINRYKELTIPAGESWVGFDTFLIKCQDVNIESIDLHQYINGDGLLYYFQIQSEPIPIRNANGTVGDFDEYAGFAHTETLTLDVPERISSKVTKGPIEFKKQAEHLGTIKVAENPSFPNEVTELYNQLDNDTRETYSKQTAFLDDGTVWECDAFSLEESIDFLQWTNGLDSLSKAYTHFVDAGFEIQTILKEFYFNTNYAVDSGEQPAQMYVLAKKWDGENWFQNAAKVNLVFMGSYQLGYEKWAIRNSNNLAEHLENYWCFDGIFEIEENQVFYAWLPADGGPAASYPDYFDIGNASFAWNDNTAPTIKAIYVPSDVEFHYGQSVPLVVEFDEPVYGNVELVINDGTDSRRTLESTESENTCSSFRSFLYEVGREDNTMIVISGISGTVKNYFGTEMKHASSFGGVTYTELDPLAVDGVSENGTFTTESIIKSPRPYDNIVEIKQLTADYSATASYAGFELSVYKSDSLNTMWANLEALGYGIYACVNESDELIPVKLSESDGTLHLTVEVPLPPVYDEDAINFIIDFYVKENGKLTLLRSPIPELTNSHYGIYVKYAVKKAPEDAFTITMADGSAFTNDAAWPSDVSGTVNLLDGAIPAFAVVDNGKDFTFKDADQFYWTTGDPNVAEMIKNGDEWILHPVSAGTTTLTYMAKNGTEDTVHHTAAAQSIEIMVMGGGTPGIVIPQSANTFFARKGDPLYVPFSSNLATSDPDGESITVELYDADGNLTWSSMIDRTSTKASIPGDRLVNISVGGAPAYRLVLRTTVMIGGSSVEKTAEAYIVVRSAPAVIALTGLPSTTYLEGNSVELAWTVENYDDTNSCAFELRVEKDGRTVLYTENVGSGGDQTYFGSVSLELKPITADDVLKESYVVTVRAKNADDPTWSVDSVILTAYRDGSLEILVEDESVSETTLKNTVAESGTVVNPTITNVEGKTFGGNVNPLGNAAAVTALRSELSLLKSVSINYDAYDWSMLDDMIAWSTDDAESLARAVTINYRQGSLYEPIENFSYLYYLPKTIMMLCGLRDGTSIVTAQHKSVEGLSDTLTVNVEVLKDKLYLFQFAPAVETTVYYVNGNGEECVVTSNSDGSLVLYEESGIVSDLRAVSKSGGIEYRGTFRNYSLRSGEGIGTSGELYPMNKYELRPTAIAEILLQYPDGKPYANKQVTLRGGVYRNRYLAEERDDAYCPDAMFAKMPGEAANLPGTEDQIFTTDKNGLLTVYMDQTQFKSAMHTDEVDAFDDMEFIFELRFTEEGADYFPALITVDGTLNARNVMRSADNVLTLEENSAQEPVMHIAVQTVNYASKLEVDVRKHTGYVGPNANNDRVELQTTVMLWGSTMESAMEEFGEDGYTDLRSIIGMIQHTAQQSSPVTVTTYPFSSIPLISNLAVLTADTMRPYRDSSVMMALQLRDKENRVVYLAPFPFRVIDMTEFEKIEESDALLSLMTNISIFGTTAPSSGYTLIDGATGVINYALDFVEKLGGEAGLTRCILTPTEDPTHWTGYFWTGMDTTKLEDLNYDQNGICTEISWIGEGPEEYCGTLNDTFTYSNYKAMADGSYFDDRSSLYGNISSAIGIPIMLKMEGWMSTELLYNFENREWEVMMTGGGFSAGGQLEFEKPFNFFPMGVPVNVTLKLRGGIEINFEAAVRYAEQLGLEWNDETAQAVNDYLTALRINAYFELFGGLGYDKKFTAKLGPYGILELNNENRFLTREYLKDKNQRSLDAQYLQLDGEIGMRVAIGVSPVVAEFSLIHYNFSKNWKFSDAEWNAIDHYWKNATSGLESQMSQNIVPYSNSMRQMLASGSGFAVADSVVKLQDRDYLENNARSWNGGVSANQYALRAAPVDVITSLQTNAYPYSMPLVSDDGKLLVYLSDADSTNVEDIEVRYVQAAADGSFPNDGQAIPGGMDGYADSSLTFDGDSTFAGAAWLRESASVGLKAGTPLDLNQQILLMNGFEVMASIWDGNSWQTTRITENATQDMEPVIAVDGNKAIVAWRSTQTSADENDPLSTTEERVLFKIYDGNDWSEAYVLYNGSSGNILGLDAEMIGDTAVVALALDASESDTTVSVSDNTEIWYAVIDTNAADLQDSAKLIRATYNEDIDQSPDLETAVMENENVFVLGWNSVSTKTGVEQSDIRFLVFRDNGAPVSNFPNSLSDMLGTTDFSGQFSLVKGADSITDLSVVWNDAGVGENNNDVLRAVKFGKYDGIYSISAPITVAEMPAETSAEHFDAYMLSSTDGMAIKAVIQGATMLDDYDTFEFSYEYEDVDGSIKTHEGIAQVPKTTTDLYTASATYTNAVAVSDVMTDFSTLTTNTPTPITFTITNSGIAVLKAVNIDIAGVTTDISGLHLLPGQSKTVSVAYTTGDRIEDLPYTVRAEFTEGTSAETSAVLYLDYPDIGISDVKVTREADGERDILVTMYNQSAADIAKNGSRRVKLGFYNSSDYTTPIDSKYFDFADDVVTLTDDNIAALDAISYTHGVTFNIGAYITDAGYDEIPDGGVPIFVKAFIEENKNGEWIVLPEADALNNTATIRFKSLLERSDTPAMLTVSQQNNDVTTATVQIQNLSLTNKTEGNIAAILLDENGNILEVMESYPALVTLDGEENKTVTFTFTQIGAEVQVFYSDTSAADNSDTTLTSISLTGTMLSLDSFDDDNAVTIDGDSLPGGNVLLSVQTKDRRASVTVNGKKAEAGFMPIYLDGKDKTLRIEVTSADGKTTETYVILIQYEKETPSIPDIPIIIPIYHVEIADDIHGGEVSVNRELAYRGNSVTVTVTPDADYELVTLTVTDSRGNAIAVTRTSDSKYTFNMPGYDVVINAEFAKIGAPAIVDPIIDCPRDYTCPMYPFIDLDLGAWYHDGVHFCIENGLMNGTSTTTFAPGATTSRAMIVTILWRLEGMPVVNYLMQFDDIAADQWYTEAIRWAASEKIVEGYGNGKFGTNDPITREQFVTIMYRYAQKKGYDVSVGENANILSFDDAFNVAEWAIPAMQWACVSGLIQGITDGNKMNLESQANATRAQAATILYRFCEAIKENDN